MPFDGSARPPAGPQGSRLPPEATTWTPRAFSAPVNPALGEWGRFLLALGCGLVLFGGLSLLLLVP